jgi:hypothetical protein
MARYEYEGIVLETPEDEDAPPKPPKEEPKPLPTPRKPLKTDPSRSYIDPKMDDLHADAVLHIAKYGQRDRNYSAPSEMERFPIALASPEVKVFGAKNVPPDDEGRTSSGMFYPESPRPYVYVNTDRLPGKSLDEQLLTILHEIGHYHAKSVVGETEAGEESKISLRFKENMGNSLRATFYRGDADVTNPEQERALRIHKNKIQNEIVTGLVKNKDYIREKYGISDFYLTEEAVKSAKSRDRLFEEQLATIGAIEEKLGIDLTEDPKLKREVFSDKYGREAYRSLLGMRLLRTDKNDLPVGRPKQMVDSYKTQGFFSQLWNAVTGPGYEE